MAKLIWAMILLCADAVSLAARVNYSAPKTKGGGGEEEEVARIPFEKTEPVEKTESSIKEEAQAVPQMAGQEAQAVPQVYAAAHEVHTVVQEASI
jgi:hypothetical protein